MLNEVDSIRAKYHRDVMEAVEYGDGDFYVYIHFRNDTGFPFYVGKGRNDRVKVRNRSYNRYWTNVVSKAGYTKKVIRNCGADEKLSLDYETELIALFREIGFGMSNLTNGGEGISGYRHTDESREKIRIAGLGRIWSDETIERMSKAKLGKTNSPEHIEKMRQANLGKTLSEETKRKIGLAVLGRTHTDEVKEKLRILNIGRTHTDEAKDKVRQAHLGKTLSDEHKEKISIAHLGKTLSDEHKEKISIAKLGKTNSPEHKEKMRQANLGKTLSEETKRKIGLAVLGRTHTDEAKEKIGLSKLRDKSTSFKGFVIGFNSSHLVIFCGTKDMVERGFNKGNVSQMILNNPRIKSVKGYTAFIRTDSPADVIHLLEGREFADEESRVHWEYFDSHYF